MNKVELIGRLTRDPDIRRSQSENNMTISRFSLAVDRKSKKNSEQTADFINCIAFGSIAEVTEKYVFKGNKIAVIGHIRTGSYKNKDGNNIYTTEVIVDELEFLEKKDNNKSIQKDVENERSDAISDVSSDGFMNIPDGLGDDGLPFN